MMLDVDLPLNQDICLLVPLSQLDLASGRTFIHAREAIVDGRLFRGLLRVYSALRQLFRACVVAGVETPVAEAFLEDGSEERQVGAGNTDGNLHVGPDTGLDLVIWTRTLDYAAATAMTIRKNELTSDVGRGTQKGNPSHETRANNAVYPS